MSCVGLLEEHVVCQSYEEEDACHVSYTRPKERNLLAHYHGDIPKP
jgi:hypothetical protein